MIIVLIKLFLEDFSKVVEEVCKSVLENKEVSVVYFEKGINFIVNDKEIVIVACYDGVLVGFYDRENDCLVFELVKITVDENI